MRVLVLGVTFVAMSGTYHHGVQAFVPTITTNGMRRLRRSHSLHAVSSTMIRPTESTSSPSSSSSLSKVKNKQHDDTLENLGLPFGLRQVLLQSLDLYKKRIWIIDNSGSMALHDGHSILTQDKKEAATVGNNSTALATCTRWAEVVETVNCHAMLAASIQAPTEFRLLNPAQNGPQSFRVGFGRAAMKDCQRMQRSLARNAPQGQTPLAGAVAKLRNEIVQMLPELHANGQKVAVVIATDGCNYNKNNIDGNDDQMSQVQRNRELLAALKSLQGLPVTVAVRLCTDYGPVMDFYNTLDESLSEDRFGIDIDVLDDYLAEAAQVYHNNPWLNYALVLHRMREMGQESALFDLLDERPFTRAEIKEFCTLLFGVPEWPADWNEFLQVLHARQVLEKPQINPQTQSLAPWVDVRQLFVIGCYWQDSCSLHDVV